MSARRIVQRRAYKSAVPSKYDHREPDRRCVVNASQLTRLIVLRELATSLAHGIAMMVPGDDPALVLRAAGNNAAQTISFLGEPA